MTQARGKTGPDGCDYEKWTFEIKTEVMIKSPGGGVGGRNEGQPLQMLSINTVSRRRTEEGCVVVSYWVQGRVVKVTDVNTCHYLPQQTL